MIAAIELGGTKTIVAIGNAAGEMLEQVRFPTSEPNETLGHVTAWLSGRGVPSAIGIAAFGPINIAPGRKNYGSFLKTPKLGWSGFSLVKALHSAFPSCELALDTDVNAAALAEAGGLEDIAYITIGTGIGAGILVGGRLVHGALHSEFGHLKVPRAAGDEYPGICPFHHDCLEGLASGPALAARWGRPAHEIPAAHPAWEMEAWYLAHGILCLAAIVSPARVIVGGGVSQVGGFHARIQRQLATLAAGYFPPLLEPDFIVPPQYGQEAGIRGALLLAAKA